MKPKADTKHLLELIDRLTVSYINASECGGDLHCYFCGEFFPSADASHHIHDTDCAWAEAKRILEGIEGVE